MLKRFFNKPAAPAAGDDIDAARAAKRKKGLMIKLAAAALAVIAAAVLAMLPNASQSGGSITAKETLVSAQALTGDIDTVFRGSGALVDDTAEEVTIPASVELIGYTVRNGDTVSKGDVLASVTRSSVLVAAAELQETMDELDAEIAASTEDNISSVISAKADGRVKLVYVEKDENVQDAMYDHGALVLISLDGLMALDIDSDGSLTPGQSVTVTLSDGTRQSGVVAQIDQNVATVTLSDETAGYGELVTVTDADGRELGSGELYIHSELKVTGFTGVAHDIYVAEGYQVFAKQRLIALLDTEYDGNYKSLMQTRQEYSQQMEELMRMYSEGYVYAQCDGIITGISDGAKYVSLSAQSGSVGVQLLSCAGDMGAISLLSSETPDDGPLTAPSGNESEPTPTPEPPEPVYTKYVGSVTAVSYGQISMKIAPSPVDIDGAALPYVDKQSFTQNTSYCPDGGTAVFVYTNGSAAQGDLNSISAGDVLLLTFADGALVRIDCLHTASSPETPQESPAKTTTGTVGTAGTNSAVKPTEETEESAPTETLLCSVVPNERMSLVISVDELDILSLAVGQEAVVTLDAVSGQSFRGVVTALDPEGVNEGGGTKYSLTLTIDRTGLMLSGMNASARITVGGAENVLLIPEAAVFEDGNRSYVYTGYDKKTDTLTTPVEVTTGVSDGTDVQILSGLEPGATVYYKYADRLSYS